MISLIMEISQSSEINNKFVIQMHIADKAGRHFDIRLGKDNVLKSWATKNLELLLAGEKKKILLFKTPDHTPEWIDFTGIIKTGYGKGKVSIWDSGNYDIEKWDNNTIIINFNGNKIKGKYVFIKMDNENQYLFFKKKE